MYLAMNTEAKKATPFVFMMKSVLWMGESKKDHYVVLPLDLKDNYNAFKERVTEDRKKAFKDP